MDPFKLTSATMLEPIEPWLSKLESEALIAMCHFHSSVRLPAVELLYSARALGQALAHNYERMVDLISGAAQERDREKERQKEIDEIVMAEEEAKMARRKARQERRLAEIVAGRYSSPQRPKGGGDGKAKGSHDSFKSPAHSFATQRRTPRADYLKEALASRNGGGQDTGRSSWRDGHSSRRSSWRGTSSFRSSSFCSGNVSSRSAREAGDSEPIVGDDAAREVPRLP